MVASGEPSGMPHLGMWSAVHPPRDADRLAGTQHREHLTEAGKGSCGEGPGSPDDGSQPLYLLHKSLAIVLGGVQVGDGGTAGLLSRKGEMTVQEDCSHTFCLMSTSPDSIFRNSGVK